MLTNFVMCVKCLISNLLIPVHHQSVWGFYFTVRKEVKQMAKKGGVSGKTHTRKQLNDYANQHNPNNPAYRARLNNHANQCNPNFKGNRIRVFTLKNGSFCECDQPDD